MNGLFDQASHLGALLKQRKETIAIAESSSGGLISAALLSVAGASSYFLGGGVIYTRDARRELLGLPEDIVSMPGANEDYARIAAKAIHDKFGCTWGLCETGATGPSGNRYGNPPGHVAIAVMGPVERSMTLETGNDDRQANMWAFAGAALSFLEETLKNSTG